MTKAAALTILLGAVLVLGTIHAQENQNVGGQEGVTDLSCPSTGGGPESGWDFKSGSGLSLLAWCVSRLGNVVRLESPEGFEHLSSINAREGYVLCNGTDALAYNYGLLPELGWAPGSVVLAGPSGSGITLRRVTSNGFWQLDQKFQRDSKEHDITITMTVTNLGPTVADVRLQRLAFLLIDNSETGPGIWMDRTTRGVTGRLANGLSLINTQWNQRVDAAFNVVTGCSPSGLATPTQFGTTGRVTAHLGSLGTGRRVSTKFVYRRY